MDLPFTNIRQVLSLHNKVSPEKIFLTVISDQGRQELSYGEFSARCHQTANFLQEDLGIQPDDVVSIQDYNLSDMAVSLMACWLVGAVAALHGAELKGKKAHVKAYFVRDYNDGRFRQIANLPLYEGKSLVQLGGTPTEGYPHFDTLVRGMPNSFFNDHPQPTLDSLAFVAPYYVQEKQPYSTVSVTQGELLASAQKLAHTQFITGNQRLMSYLTLSGLPIFPGYTLNAMTIFISALLVGGSIIYSEWSLEKIKPDVWHLIAAERLHIACLNPIQLRQLITFAKEQKALGKPIYGEGIYQQDIQQLRHIYCPDAKGHDDLIQQFTAMFPFPVVTNI